MKLTAPPLMDKILPLLQEALPAELYGAQLRLQQDNLRKNLKFSQCKILYG